MRHNKRRPGVVYELMCKFLAGLKRPWYEGDCEINPIP